MSVDDFYSPPNSAVSDAGQSGDLHAQGAVIAGGEIYAHTPLDLPTDICLKCGSRETGGTVYDKKVYYIPRWTALLILLNVLLMAIVQMIVRKRIDVTFYRCPECVQKRKRRIMLSVGGLVAAIAGFAGGIAADNGAIIMVGAIGIVVGIIAVAIFARAALRAKAYEDGRFTLTGAADEFCRRVTEPANADGTDGTAMW